MVATLSGSWMLSKALHPLNAYWLIAVSVEGRSTSVSPVQPLNAPVLIWVSPSAIVTFLNPVLFWKA